MLTLNKEFEMPLLFLLVFFPIVVMATNPPTISSNCDGMVAKIKKYSTFNPEDLKILKYDVFNYTLDDFRVRYGSTIDDTIAELERTTALTHEQIEYHALRQLRILESFFVSMGLRFYGVTHPQKWEQLHQECVGMDGKWPAM